MTNPPDFQQDDPHEAATNITHCAVNSMIGAYDSAAFGLLALVDFDDAMGGLSEALSEVLFVGFMRMLDFGGEDETPNSPPTGFDPTEALKFIEDVLTALVQKLNNHEVIEHSHPNTKPYEISINIVRKDG